MSARRALLGVLVTSLLVARSTAFAQTPDSPEGGTSVSHIAGFDHIETEKFDYNLNTGDFSIPGHFTATRSGTDVTADHATGNSKSKIMHAEGHVVVHQSPGGPPGHTSDLTAHASTLTCDKLDVDGTTKVYTATGNMHYSQQGGREATSDNAVLDDGTHHLHMQGHVRVRSGEQTVEADTLDYDTLTGQLDGNGNVTITAPVETPLPGTARAPKPKKKKII
jgi:lipopolysaccharide assembly outer membrane protein LptD (OstA)